MPKAIQIVHVQEYFIKLNVICAPMWINLFEECSRLVNQIPAGSVSTYGTVAKALGDHIARRAVGVMLNQYKPPIKMPCHRIVYAGGGLGARRSDRIDRAGEGSGCGVDRHTAA